MLWDNIL